MRLTEAGFAPDEQWVVGPGGCLGNREGSGVGEPVRGADDEGVKGVAPIQAGAAGGFRVSGLWSLGEVGRPVLMRAGESLAVFVNLVDIGQRFVGHQAVIGFVTGQGGDTDAELDLLAEPTAQRLGDLGTQVSFDFVLDEAAGHRQQSEPFDDRQRLYKVQPGSLLRCQGRDVRFAVGYGSVWGDLAVEFGDDRIPDRRET